MNVKLFVYYVSEFKTKFLGITNKYWHFTHMWEKKLDCRIISLTGEVWVNRTSLTRSLFIEVSVPSQESASVVITSPLRMKGDLLF